MLITVGIIKIAAIGITAAKIGADFYTNKSTESCLFGIAQHFLDKNKTLSEEK